MANRMQHAVSMLAFQWIRTVSPSVARATGGAISTGLPLSNRANSMAVMRAPRPPGRPITVTSCTRPRLPSAASSMGAPPRQRNRAASAWAPGCWAANASKVWRTLRVNSASFQSAGGMVTATIGSGATMSAKAGRSATPSTVAPNKSASRRAVSSAAGICSF